MDILKEALELHKQVKGKLEIKSKTPIHDGIDLARVYTPGVAEPCKVIAENEEEVYTYTGKGNTVAVISDGSAVLGLGNIGSRASIPVMEGKAVLFKEFAGIDAFPICLDTQDTEEIISIVQKITPTLGGINLEDISSPRCFEIEKRLKETLDIPVFHDDQHGTAVVVTAGLINALKLANKNLKDVKIVLSGPGAAGTAIIKMLLSMGAKNIIVNDIDGILSKDNAEKHKRELAQETNPEGVTGGLAEAIVGADVFIGVSAPNVLKEEMVSSMATDAIVFALANPVPEIDYHVAKKLGVKVVATGRSDFPNQVNNVLAFPGIFRGALDVRASQINDEMKHAAAEAIANSVSPEELSEEFVMPDPFNPEVAKRVAEYVARAAVATGVNRLPLN